MLSGSSSRLEPIPSGHRLLHIGIPKTGTTSLQYAAAVNRDRLLGHGVRYPGREINHRLAVSALMQRPLGWKDAGAQTPPPRAWLEVQAAVDADPERRALISHEFCCEADDTQAQRFVDALGPDRLHVAVSLRGFADLLASSWQQAVKSGDQRTFDAWLKVVLGPKAATKAPVFTKRNDQAAIVRRWCRLLGPERVHVVIADKARPAQLIDAFEDLLDLPRGALADRPTGGYAANRTLSAAEAEVVRGLNQVMRSRQFQWGRYTQLVREGVVARLQETRRPSSEEPVNRLPRWAAEPALDRGRRYAEAIVGSGCQLVGDPATLHLPVGVVERSTPVEQVPTDVAVEALAGLLSAAEGWGPFFGEEDDTTAAFRQGRLAQRLSRSERGRSLARTVRASAHLPVVELAAAVGYRGWQNLRRRLR